VCRKGKRDKTLYEDCGGCYKLVDKEKYKGKSLEEHWQTQELVIKKKI